MNPDRNRCDFKLFLGRNHVATLSVWLILIAICSAIAPPCPAPFPNSAVNETWCSTILAINRTTGVTVAEYDLPAQSLTLVTVSTNSSIWYEEALFFLGGGIGGIFDYMGGRNAKKQSIIATARTVPLIIRPLSPLASPPGWWQTSMLVSPAHFPDTSTLPAPTTPYVRLETLTAHTFATLDFAYTNPPGQPFPLPPYFTYFLRCDEQLAAGLPRGWAIKADSVWTPSWLLYNGEQWNGTWTSRCLAEVEPAREPAAVQHAVARPSTEALLPGSTSTAQDARPATANDAPPRNMAQLPLSTGAAPPACGVLLEFETVYWGAWAGPHTPNVALLDINGGTDGLYALDHASRTFFMATSSDGPFFTLRLAVIDIATGSSRTLGNNWPSSPAGFEGVNGLFFSVDFAPALGLIVGMTEISKYGPLPPVAAERGLPVGWTVIARVDPATGASTALTSDLTPALTEFPQLVSGLSALDAGRAMLWVLAAGPGSRPYSTGSAGAPAAYFVGLELSPAAPKPTALPAAGASLIVCGFAYASAVDALVSIEFNSTEFNSKRGLWTLPNAEIAMYPINGTGRTVIATLRGGIVNPAVGQVDVTADGRFVYFGAVQGSAAFEAPALVTVDVVNRIFSLALAPGPDTDDYDVLALSRCE